MQTLHNRWTAVLDSSAVRALDSCLTLRHTRHARMSEVSDQEY